MGLIMKSMVLIAILFLGVNAFANARPSLKNIPSVEEVSWALESSRWDIEESIYFSFDEVEDPIKMNCESKDKSEVIALFELAIKKYNNYFPDEELPFKSALVELNNYLDRKVLEYCYMNIEDEKILQVYFNSNFLVSIGQ
jgi:hypothetical protein